MLSLVVVLISNHSNDEQREGQAERLSNPGDTPCRWRELADELAGQGRAS